MIKPITVFASLALASHALGQTNAAATIGYVQNGTDYTYDITLHNTGTTTIGTLWYAWIPGEDYLPLVPTSTVTPNGWTLKVVNGTAGVFGHSLQWVAPTGGLLTSGASLDGFKFTTTTTPAEVFGDAIFGNHPPVGTSFVYEGKPFVGGSKQFVITPVPEPASLFALAPGFALLVRRARLCDRRKARCV